MNPRFPRSGGRKSKAEQIAKAGRQELLSNFRKRSDQISALLFRRDPLKLSFGTNEDEYEMVAWAIVTQLITTPTKEYVLGAVHRGFHRTFGAEKTGPISNYKVIAKEIWGIWRSSP